MKINESILIKWIKLLWKWYTSACLALFIQRKVKFNLSCSETYFDITVWVAKIQFFNWESNIFLPILRQVNNCFKNCSTYNGVISRCQAWKYVITLLAQWLCELKANSVNRVILYFLSLCRKILSSNQKLCQRPIVFLFLIDKVTIN